jgi:hypothetical protein
VKKLISRFVIVFILGTIGCIVQPPPSTSAVTEISYLSREVIPSETDTTINQWDEPHYVCFPEAFSQRRGTLWVFLPGTGAVPSDYTTVTQEAAKAGLHAISLRYPNDKSVNLQLCPFDNDLACHEKIRTEIVTGVDVSKHVSVDSANSIEGRLRSVISYMHSHFPDEGWGQYMGSDGEIVWSSVVIAGHSQGGGHAVYIAREHRVHHVISFAWVDVKNESLAPWLTESPSQTPPDGYYLFWHQDDTRVAAYQPDLMTALELDQFGVPIIVDNNTPPYKGSHALVAAIPSPYGERAHNTHVADKALVVDESGVPVYSPVWRFLMTLEGYEPSEEVSSSVFQPKEAVRMGFSEGSYIDPEFYSSKNLAAFTDEKGQIWLAMLDPVTGTFISSDGKDILVDEEVTPLRISFNGPEFGVDRHGWALVYTKNIKNTPQIWKATIEHEAVRKTPVTTDSVSRLSVLASKSVSSETIRLLYSSGGVSRADGRITWLDEDDPDATETVVDITDVGVRWIDTTRAFTFSRMSGPEKGQIALYDTETAMATTITNTQGTKSYSYGWIAPECDEILVMVVVDNARIEVYKDNGGTYWDCVSTLRIPEESQYNIIGSPEPFIAGKKSYISLVIKESEGYSPAEVWVWGIEEGDNHVALRCSDGQGDVIRSDPESFIGQQKVFIYYNVLRQEKSGKLVFELFMWDTGIRSFHEAEDEGYSDTFSRLVWESMQYVFFGIFLAPHFVI